LGSAKKKGGVKEKFGRLQPFPYFYLTKRDGEGAGKDEKPGKRAWKDTWKKSMLT